MGQPATVVLGLNLFFAGDADLILVRLEVLVVDQVWLLKHGGAPHECKLWVPLRWVQAAHNLGADAGGAGPAGFASLAHGTGPAGTPLPPGP